MAALLESFSAELTSLGEEFQELYLHVQHAPISFILILILTTVVGFAGLFYTFLLIVAPTPRLPLPSEKTYRTILPDGTISDPKQLPCWLDQWAARNKLAKRQGASTEEAHKIEEPEVFMSVVVPAYNEEQRLGGMLEEAVEFLQREYGDAHGAEVEARAPSVTAKSLNGEAAAAGETSSRRVGSGWEILIVSDGSSDHTEEYALNFARDHQLSQYPTPVPGPWKAKPGPTHIPHGSIRVIRLEKNRGKGGAVTHGMRHARGQYVVFADADGASEFTDLKKLVAGCQEIEDSQGRGVGIGSRSHLVGSEAVVKRSRLRNFLMHSFHLLLWVMTPPATSRIKDTQCGFKLFSRAALPYIIPYMHSEGWIFDVEMLMLAESANVPMAEVAVGWKEVMGSKLNVVWDSLGMAWGLAVLRASWMFGVYSRA
ncbi:Dolichyl-phosphate beta-glucosyltransferase [Lasiodiplodia hormozganensis]|uniref:dolichyl-phosphate beta-glucosyltransferase n=1 Tax=Lasiodiplodia hormozganensis TaxID=869390 RepID=A0AA39YXT8_9PEZI|nr:Dolichyl-phosphate beta-glucosyltransferase [Lasiodiplodia hormozganensis]